MLIGMALVRPVAADRCDERRNAFIIVMTSPKQCFYTAAENGPGYRCVGVEPTAA